jgi:integrase
MARPRTTNKHLPKYVTIIHGSFWYRPPKPAKPERICPADDEAGMYRWVGEKLGPRPTTPTSTLNDVFDRYEREVLPTKESRTQKDYRRHLVVLRKKFGHMGPNDLLPEHVGRFLDVERGKIQRNRMVSLLSAIYTKAVGRWYVAKANPCIGVERNESQPRDRLVSDAEFAAFYKLANPKIQVAMDLALLTGQRQGTLLRLKWSQITAEGVLIQQANKGGKKGKRLLVEMSPALQAVLERARAFLPHLPREYVLRTRKGKAFTQNGFRSCWQRTMTKFVKQGGERFTFHDLRAKSGSDSETLQGAFERLGHTSMTMTRRVYDRGVRKVKPLR